VKHLEQSPTQLVEVYAGSRRDAHEHALVLHALRIPHNLLRAHGQTHILVQANDAPKARTELEQYAAEGALRSPRPAPANSSAGFLAAGLWCFGLSFAHILMTRFASVQIWRDDAVSVASEVRSGEWWRTITALTLHADLVHLLSNLVFGALLLGILAAEIGVGTALLLTILGGALGNWTNALLAGTGHASVGASTAVFASLGILVGGRFRSDRAGPARSRAWVPLVAGLALLGWLGGPSERMGESGLIRTDVSAHVLGLTFGLLLGLMLLRPGQTRSHQHIQLAACGALVCAAWALVVL